MSSNSTNVQMNNDGTVIQKSCLIKRKSSTSMNQSGPNRYCLRSRAPTQIKQVDAEQSTTSSASKPKSQQSRSRMCSRLEQAALIENTNNSRGHKHSTRSKRALDTCPDDEDSDELHEPLTKKKILGSLSFGSQPSDSLEHPALNLVTSAGKVQVSETEKQPISNFVSKGIFSQDGFLASMHDEHQEDTPNVSHGICINHHDGDGSQGALAAASSARKSSRKIRISNTGRARAKTVDNRPASEKALTVDLILKSLFTYADVPTLKASRAVCQRWDHFASKELQQRVTIKLSFGHFVDNSPKSKSVPILISLMSSSSSSSSSSSQKIFPCTAFTVSTQELSSPRIQDLFDSVGAQMKKLCLSLDYRTKKITFEQSSLMSDLSHLLIHQVPNLEFLEIKSSLPEHWREKLREWDANPVAVNPTFFLRERSGSGSGTGSGSENGGGGGNIINSCLLPKLKSLHLSGPLISKKVLQDIMDAAVNLRSYNGPSYPGEMLEYFIDGKGKDRIHLLKKLDFILDMEGVGSIGTMERLLEKHHHQRNLLQLDFLCFLHPRPSIDTTALWPRAVHILNQLLSSSSGTLKELVINPMRFLPGLVIPRVPLELLVLKDNSLDDSSDNYFFPQGFSLASAFPLVHAIGIISDFNCNSIRLLDISEPVPSVKQIHMSSRYKISHLAVSALALKCPNAFIKYG